jgi:hypothetical protein
MMTFTTRPTFRSSSARAAFDTACSSLAADDGLDRALDGAPQAAADEACEPLRQPLDALGDVGRLSDTVGERPRRRR